MYIYRTYFTLTACVNDVSAAREYLTHDDMTQYLKNNKRIPEDIKNAVEKIEWHLKDEDSGNIELTTNRALSDTELKPISNWVSGQNSDGLGEGFEQQEFANYQDTQSDYGYDDDNDYYEDDSYVMASFDWQTNDYKFEFFTEI